MGLLTDIVRNRIAEHDARERERRESVSKGIFSMITAGVQNKTLTPEQFQFALDELGKIHKGKESKETLGRFGGIVGNILSAPIMQGTTQAPDQTPTGEPGPPAPPEVKSPTGEPVPGAPSEAAQALPPPQMPQTPQTAAEVLPPPRGVGALVPDWAKAQEREREAVRFGTEEDVRKAQLLYEQRKKIGKELDLKGEALNDYAATGHYPTPQKPLVIKGLEREGQEGLWTKRVYSDGTVEWDKEGPKATAIRVTAAEATTLPHARELAKQGKVYQDESGQPLDLNAIPEGMVLQAVHQGPKTFYTTRDVADKSVTVGGVMYAVNPYEVQKLPEGAGTRVGTVAIPRTGTTTVAAVNPATGEMVYNVMPTTSTPQATGIPGRPEAPSPTAPPAAPPAPGAQPSPSPPPAPGSTPGLRGVPMTSLNPLLQRLTPVREAYSQVFGDPSQPEFTPLASYADLADDSASKQKLGAALRYTFDQLNASESQSKEGFWAWTRDISGFSNELARARAQVLQGALGELSPRETEAYNATVDAISTAVGLRTLSRASASQASVKRIESDVPVIGVNVDNSRAFYDKLVRLAEITYNGSVGLPANMFKPGELEGLKALPSQMRTLRDKAPTGGARKVLGAPPKVPAVGEVRSGWKFKGGDPASPGSWEKVSGAGR